MTTALNTYRNLEQTGWVVTHARSGFFVSSPHDGGDIPKQPQFRTSLRSASASHASRSYLNGSIQSGPFGISQLSPSQMPLLSLKRSIKRALHRGDDFLHKYPDPQGIYELRRAISGHFQTSGFVLGADDVCISNGCMDAIRLALLVTTKPGDAVGISSPCFNGLLKLLANLSRKVVEIPCNSDGIDLEQLEQKIQNKQIQACLLSSSFMNPHGISLSTSQKQQLATLSNKHRLPIIEDDVYGELAYENTFPLPIKYWDKNGYVIWCSSVSKTLSNGLRIGWSAPGRFLQASIDMCASERLGQNALMQASLADFINSGQYRSHLNLIRKTMFVNAYDYRKLLLQNLPKGSAVSAPNGGLVLWVQVPKLNDAKLQKFAEIRKIDIQFGKQFTTRKLYRDCFRINLGWKISDMHDDKRTIKDVLLELSEGVFSAVA